MKQKIGTAMLFLLVAALAAVFVTAVVSTVGWLLFLKVFGTVALLATYVFIAIKLIDSKEE